jgi:dTDP-L-rhamnose 4-epimerase
MKNIESILITGGAGFVGLKTARRFTSLGYRVVLLDNLLPQIHGERIVWNEELRKLNKEIPLIVGDVLNPDVWKRALKDIDAVLHLAALTGTGQSMYETYNYTNVNIGGTSIFLDLLPAYKHKIKRVVIASSRSVYGEGKYRVKKTGRIFYPSGRNTELMARGVFEFVDDNGNELIAQATDEQTPANPLSTYAVTKYAQEKMILNTCSALGVEALALRYQNVYGPGQSLKNPYTGIVSIFSTAIIKGQKINVFEDGLASRDFVFIDDVAEANSKAMQAGGLANTAINVGTGLPISILDVVNMLGKHLNKTPQYSISGEFRAGDIRHNYADITLMKSLLGFESKVSFEEGTEKFVKWLLAGQENNLADDSQYLGSLEEMRSKGLMGRFNNKV